MKDLIAIHGDEYHLFEKKIVPNCFCSNCNTNYASTIVNYEIYLNDLNDIILKGFCDKCGSRMNRYLETGEVEKYQEAIGKIKERYSKN
ncbi:MAG: hypothetical protein HW400_181 [Candidatus Levybacteria bacterium]|nr:hypothetical protein [Candidatus Levybacteria bacterium]